MMKKILAAILAVTLMLALSSGVFAASNVTDAVKDGVRFYNNNPSYKRGALTDLALAQLYRPLPEQFIKDEYRTPVEKPQSGVIDVCVKVIISAAMTNIKLSVLAPDWDPVATLAAEQKENGSFGDSYLATASAVMALLAVNADFNKDKAVDYLLSVMTLDEEAEEKGIIYPVNDGGTASAGVNYYDTFLVLLALSSFRGRSDVGRAYLTVKESFLSTFGEDGVYKYRKYDRVPAEDVNALALACAVDYGVDDVTSDEWKNALSSLLATQDENGDFKEWEHEGSTIDALVYDACFFGVTAVYMGQSGIGKLTEGRGFIDPDFSGDLLTAALITLAGVGIIAVVVLVIHAMNKGKKARMKDSEKSDEKAVP